MNIVVIGGGKPGKFGNDFCNRARSEGHDVYVISHKDYGTNDPKQIVADFNNVAEFLEKFKNLTNHLDKIDVLLYNSNGHSYPGRPEELQSTGGSSLAQWEKALRLHVAIPHALAIEALKKMTKGCGIVFMTSGMSYDLKRTNWTANVGYAGFKGMQNHLMIGLAHHNDKEAIVTCIAPHFPYDNAEKYSNVLNIAYEYITNLTEENNGRIRGIWDNSPKYMN
jgi:NAD(P)-dependent dehydrogenase (short-subunit alcohol dehydrogenase family)